MATPNELLSLCQHSLIAYSIASWQGYLPAEHHRKIARALERVERGECKRLMISMPPRHGKSMLASEFFPAWYMGKHPDKQVIHATYAQELADGFGRKIRNQMKDELFQTIFPGVTLAEDSTAAARFHVSCEGSNGQSGVYHAVGIGGGATGKGADLLLIDDPVKDREEAESELKRNKIKDWYKSVAYTRLMPGAAILLIQCMTGDTMVLMADGSEKELRSIAVGDLIATYENDRLTEAKVLNWVNQGGDQVYSIKTSSGTIVKANERHPFLVERQGSRQWIKVKDLKIGDRVMRATGASGGASLVLQKGASSQQSAKACAQCTTTNTYGQAGIDRRPTTPSRVTKPGSSAGTTLLLQSLQICHCAKVGYAPFASNRQEKTLGRTGVGNCASIIATTPERSGACCATTATSLLATEKQSEYCSPPLNTFGITLDAIVEITDAGVEDVFDIQVERTENFIANGLVSHNTRWHDDDLMGWLLADHGHEGWELLSLPAINEDNQALWPESYPLERLETIRETIGPRDWEALYQQRPRAAGGAEFKRHWIQYYQTKPSKHNTTVLMLVDPASGKRESNDFTSMWVIGLGQDKNYYVLDMVRDRLNLTERAETVFRLHRKWNPIEVRYERYGMMADIEYLRQEMNRKSYRFTVREVAGATAKVDRIRRLIPLFEMNRFWFPEELHYTDLLGKEHELVSEFIEQEFLSFPVARHEDMMDALARVAEPTLDTPWPRPQEQNFGSVFHYGALDEVAGY